jgi:hypothetical protein
MALDSTPELDAAVDSPEQQPRALVQISWDGSGDFDGAFDTITGYESVSLDRSVANSLPDQVSVITGEASAQATVKLANGETLSELQDAAWFYSRLNEDSPLASYDRLDLPFRLQFGYRTSSGDETIRKLTGSTTDLDVSVSEGEATLTAIDNRTVLSGPVNLPAVVADEGDETRLPGLDGQWLIDYILRQNGFDVSPAIRNNCAVFVTFHGSAFPEVGELLIAWDSTDGIQHQVLEFISDGFFAEALDAGPEVRATQDQGPNIWIRPYSFHPISTNTGDRVHAEMWAKVGSDSTGTFSFIAHTTQAHFILWEIEDGIISVSVKRNNTASTHQVSAPVLGNSDPEWFYVGLELEWTSTGATVRLRVNDTTYTGSVTSAMGIQMPAFNTVACLPDFPVEAWQITNLAPNVWRDTFESEVHLDPSINKIFAVVDSSVPDSWQLLKEIASAELGTIHFDENGVFNFWSRQHWVSEDAQTVQKTVDISQQIKTIGYKDGIAQIANSVESPVTAYTLGEAVDNLWVAPDNFVVVPGTSTTILDVDLGKAATGIITTFVPYYDPTRSWFEARLTPGGALDYSSVTVKAEIISAQKVRLTVNNTANSTRYLLESQQLPSIHLFGRPLLNVSESNTNPIVEDQTSIETYGLRQLKLAANKWRQDYSSARGIAQAVLSETAYPNPAVTAVRIVGDPRIQLGDRHQVNASAGLTGQYRVTSIKENFDVSGYEQTIDYVKAFNVLIWDEGEYSSDDVWGA